LACGRGSRCDRDADDDREEDVGEEEFDAEYLQKAEEKVGVETVGDDDVLVVGGEDPLPKGEYTIWKFAWALAFRGELGTGLVDPAEFLVAVEDDPEGLLISFDANMDPRGVAYREGYRNDDCHNNGCDKGGSVGCAGISSTIGCRRALHISFET
jgi:hypothetical protein